MIPSSQAAGTVWPMDQETNPTLKLSFSGRALIAASGASAAGSPEAAVVAAVSCFGLSSVEMLEHPLIIPSVNAAASTILIAFFIIISLLLYRI